MRRVTTKAEVLLILDIPEEISSQDALCDITPSFAVQTPGVEVVDHEMVSFEEVPDSEEDAREITINYEINVTLRVPNHMSAVKAAFFVSPEFRVHEGPPGLEIVNVEPVDIWTEDDGYKGF